VEERESTGAREFTSPEDVLEYDMIDFEEDCGVRGVLGMISKASEEDGWAVEGSRSPI